MPWKFFTSSGEQVQSAVTLDGFTANDFVTVSGDTMTGDLTMSSSINVGNIFKADYTNSSVKAFGANGFQAWLDNGITSTQPGVIVSSDASKGTITFGSSTSSSNRSNLYWGGADVVASDDTIWSKGNFNPAVFSSESVPAAFRANQGALVVSNGSSTQLGLAFGTGTARAMFATDLAGKMTWGDGALARDVNLYRGSAGVLVTDGKIQQATAPTTNNDLVNKSYADTAHVVIYNNANYNATFGGNLSGSSKINLDTLGSKYPASGYWSIVNPDTLRISTSGIYVVVASLGFDPNNTTYLGDWAIGISKDGGVTFLAKMDMYNASNSGKTWVVSYTGPLNAGDDISFHGAGPNASHLINGGSNVTYMQVTRVGSQKA